MAGKVKSYNTEYNNRIRKYFSITKDGKEALKEFEKDRVALLKVLDFIAGDILSNTNPANLKSRDWRGLVLVAVSFIMLLGCVIPQLFNMQMNVSASVGVIGGADGPTSIFVAGKIGTPWGLYIATAVVIIATIIYIVKKHKKG